MAFVGGEIAENLRLHVVGDHGDIVFRLQRLQEAIGSLQGLIPALGPILLVKIAEFDDHGDGHGRLAHAEAGDLLWNVVLQHPEVAAGNTRDEAALVVEHRGVHGYRHNVTAERQVGGRLLARLGLELRRNLGEVLVFFRGWGIGRGVFAGLCHGLARLPLGPLLRQHRKSVQ